MHLPDRQVNRGDGQWQMRPGQIARFAFPAGGVDRMATGGKFSRQAQQSCRRRTRGWLCKAPPAVRHARAAARKWHHDARRSVFAQKARCCAVPPHVRRQHVDVGAVGRQQRFGARPIARSLGSAGSTSGRRPPVLSAVRHKCAASKLRLCTGSSTSTPPPTPGHVRCAGREGASGAMALKVTDRGQPRLFDGQVEGEVGRPQPAA